MNKTTINGEICTKKEFEQFKSFYEMFKAYIEKDNLSTEKSDMLFEDINNFETVIVPIAKKAGIDLSKHTETIREIWESPELTSPEVTVAGWSGDRVEEAIDNEICKYELKLQERKEAIADLDKTMVTLYKSQPEDYKQTIHIHDSIVKMEYFNSTDDLHPKTFRQIHETDEIKQKQRISERIKSFLWHLYEITLKVFLENLKN